MTQCPQKPESDRDVGGRFRKGNPGGPGNPFNRRVAQIRKIIVETTTDDDVRVITRVVIDKAREGNLTAAKIFYQYNLGRPANPPDPDRVDIDEWKLTQESMVTREQAEAVAVHGIPVVFVTALAEVDARVNRLQPFFPTPKEAYDEAVYQRVPAEEIAYQLDCSRNDYLQDPRFRDRWNEGYRRGELREATDPFKNGNPAATPEAAAPAGESAVTPSAAPSANGLNGGAPSPNGENGRAAPSANGGNGRVAPSANGGNGRTSPLPNGGNGAPPHHPGPDDAARPPK